MIIIFHVNIGQSSKIHFTSEINFETINLIFLKVYLTWTSIFGQIGDYIFFMIAGYFALRKSNLKYNLRDWKIVFIVLQYTIIITIIVTLMRFLHLTNIDSIFTVDSNLFQTIQYFFTAGGLWFIYGYMILTLCIKPFLKVLNRISVKIFATVCITFVIISLVDIFLNEAKMINLPFPLYATISCSWAFVAGIFISKFKNEIKYFFENDLTKIRNFFILLIALSVIASTLDALLNTSLYKNCIFSFAFSTFFSVTLFFMCAFRKSFFNKYMNLVAKGTFGVYILFGPNMALNELFFNETWGGASLFSNSPSMLWFISVLALLYWICADFIEVGRLKLAEITKQRVNHLMITRSQSKVNYKENL